MTIFNTAYDTSVGLGFKPMAERVVQQLQTASIKVNFPDNNRKIVGEDFGLCKDPAATVLTNTTVEEESVEIFPYPILMPTPSKGKESDSYLVFDGRPFTTGKQLDEAGQLRVRLRTEYDFYKMMTVLTAYWMTGKQNDFKFLGKAPISIYASSIGESVARRFGLDPKDQLTITIVAAAFYSNLFNESGTLTEAQKVGLVPNLVAATHTRAEVVFEVLDRVEDLKDLNSLVKAIQDTTENTRLNDLNVGVLVTIMSGLWYGTNGKALITAALEHPPTWVTIVYMAFSERSYKHSGVSKVADRYRGNRGEIEYTRAMKNLVTKAKSGY